MNEIKNPIAVELGRNGGRKTSSIYGKPHYQRMQILSVNAKLKKRKRTMTKIKDTPIVKLNEAGAIIVSE